ncbi:hypothetical protein [Mycobacterium sp. 1164966.3]|uniref:hypothetical protein n=1 Tax=Mycobacterium sp. 1164966.3 TaxID=1856861 RepID=UPI0009EE15A0|nr:hypothetical protein [Mycobacterium sp. 1164966.3]
MHEAGRYDECVLNRGDEAHEFIAEYFQEKHVLMIAGAGFDPRACVAAQQMINSGATLDLVLIKEERPSPSDELESAAQANLQSFLAVVPQLSVVDIRVFDDDGALVGGRRTAAKVQELSLDSVDELVVDISALSIGTSFPMIRLLVDRILDSGLKTNLHITVAHNPAVDTAIRPIAGDRPGWVHGFSAEQGVDRDPEPAKLWMPQLAFRGNQELGRIYEFVGPDDTCPIVPFPASDPRLPDKLTIEFRDELLEVWEVDSRNLVYADEGDPLDVYRTILRIDDLRRPVFESNGGSTIIVSPTGSKLMALGSLIACIERDLPVAYLEAEAYEMDEDATLPDANPMLVHLWLEGDAYLNNRPALRKGSDK